MDDTELLVFEQLNRSTAGKITVGSKNGVIERFMRIGNSLNVLRS